MVDQVASTSQQTVRETVISPQAGKLSTDSVIVSSRKSNRSKRFKPPSISSSSSSDDSDIEIPSLERLRSHALQKKVDRRIRNFDQSSHLSGNDSKLKHKSKRGGNVEVSVKKKVSWPHEPILGRVSRQRVTYDQLSLTHWVQGFCKNILEQKSSERRDIMVSYLGDLMEDATDFSCRGQRQHTLCCYVRWSGVPSSGKTWIVWTVSVGPMLRNICQGGSNPRITQAGNHGIVKMIKVAPVTIHVTMN